MKKLYQQIDVLKAELDGLSPLEKEDMDRLWEKFRLEWNFNSNHIEGNTLTYSETKTLLILGDEPEDHNPRDINEMKAHNVAVDLMKKYAEDKDRNLSEADIRELNQIILVEPYWKEALTPDGKETQKEIIPGQYKKTHNAVRLTNGEIYKFASPEDTPNEMQELIEFFSTNFVSTASHPVWLAAMLHYRLVRIHPFDDGNGRVARLVMNYSLLKKGLPPVIIESEDKKNYLYALQRGDEGDLESFVKYIGKRLIWSLELSKKATRGESIEETDDVDKEISIWKKSLPKNQRKNVVSKSDNRIYKLYQSSLKPLMELFLKKHEQFAEVFAEVKIQTFINGNGVNGQIMELFDEAMQNFEQSQIQFLEAGEAPEAPVDEKFNRFQISTTLRGFKNAGINAFDTTTSLIIDYQPYKYRVRFSMGAGAIEKLYSEEITQKESEQLVASFTKALFVKIKQQSKE